MRKRDSGWYRVKLGMHDDFELALYDANTKEFHTVLVEFNFGDQDFHEIDEKMVMTLSGGLVYRSGEHDPGYNTKQEG